MLKAMGFALTIEQLPKGKLAGQGQRYLAYFAFSRSHGPNTF
jgi:hypothetical protein